MASAYDKASLVMLPNAYKDGKVYSVKPEDRSGDFTFTRPTAATRVDVNGLIEKGRENLLTYSNAFTSGNWGLSNISLTSGQAGYDGSNDAWLIQGSGVGTSRLQHFGLNFSTSLYALSFYAKAGNENVVNIFDGTWGGIVICTFDLNTGNTTGSNATLPIIDVKMDLVGNGWYRCSVIVLPPNARTNSPGFVRIGIGSTTAANSGNIYIQDAQLEQSLVATHYIETGASTAQSGITDNVPRLDYTDSSCPALLLEPLRTNLIPNSEYFNASIYNYTSGITRTANATTSPEGLQNAYLLTEDSSLAAHRIGQATWSQSVADTSVSVFAKANGRRYIVLGNANMSPNMNTWFDLENGVVGTESNNIINASIEPFKNGWYRCSISYLPNKGNTYPAIYLSDTDGAASYQGDGVSGVYLYGYQIEVNASYPTSYIPTYGSAVTRSSEQADTLEDSSLFNLAQGTLFFEGSALAEGTDRRISISDGTLNNFISIGYSRFTGNIVAEIYYNGVSQNPNWGATGITQTDNNKFALSWGSGTMKFYINGVLKLTESVTSPVGLDILRFSAGNGSLRMTSNTKQILTFPTALTDSECIALTTI